MYISVPVLTYGMNLSHYGCLLIRKNSIRQHFSCLGLGDHGYAVPQATTSQHKSVSASLSGARLLNELH